MRGGRWRATRWPQAAWGALAFAMTVLVSAALALLGLGFQLATRWMQR
jgi:hypothetical protein